MSAFDNTGASQGFHPQNPIIWPPAGHPAVVEFRVRSAGRTYGRMLTVFAAPLLLFFLVMLLLGSIVFKLVGGFIVASLATAGLAGILYWKAHNLTNTTIVRFSPTGIELVDGKGFQVRLMWHNMTRIGETLTAMSNPNWSVGRPGGVRVRSATLSSSGVIGWGQRVVPANAPSWLQQRLATVPVDPQSGLVEVTIPLGEVDAHWLTSDMGVWVHRYRPDLLNH